MRIAVAEIAQETDSFSPLRCDLSSFEAYGLYFGDEVLQQMQGVGPLGGFLDVVAEQDQAVDLVPIVRAWAAADGTITRETLEYLTERLTTGLREAMPLDGVFLSLHGAASAENDDDLEGYVLAAVREVIGNEVPIVCPMDHHANITQRMVDHADALIGHETQPHDPRATGQKAARVLFRMLQGDVRPTIGWHKIAMITPQDQYLTSRGPMKEWFDLARSMEQRDDVVDVSPYPMQCWLDVVEGGWSVVVHTNGDEELAQALADKMAEKAWQMRERFWVSERVAPVDAVQQAVSAETGLVILSDTGDSVYGGAPGDSTIILRELVAQEVGCKTLVPVVDSEVVEAAHSAGVGARVSVSLGGKLDNIFSKPVAVEATVGAASKGVTVRLGERGVCDMRKTALLQVGHIRIVVLDHRSFAINHPALYMHLGVDVADAKIVVLKTASNFQFFGQWRKELIRVDSPGMTQSDLTAFEWKRLPRPTWPLDDIEDWR